jgi:hypothetical protein
VDGGVFVAVIVGVIVVIVITAATRPVLVVGFASAEE